jgi:LuxR family maltose regulon positive regulatory protein
LSPRHNVPDVFLGALAAGFQQMVRLDVDLDLRGSLEDAVILLLNSLVDRLHDDLILILEDYDVIHEPVIHEALGLMLDYLPPLLHVVIVAEQEPPLHNLPRLRVRRQMMQVKI